MATVFMMLLKLVFKCEDQENVLHLQNLRLETSDQMLKLLMYN